MQLFSIGLIQLNDDGTPKLDPSSGQPLETYTNEDIESFARAWTGRSLAICYSYQSVAIGFVNDHLSLKLTFDLHCRLQPGLCKEQLRGSNHFVDRQSPRSHVDRARMERSISQE